MDDRQLSRLLSDAVADVEPSDRLAELRERTAPSPGRGRWYAAGGAALAAAAAVAAIAVLGEGSPPTADGPGPARSPGAETETGRPRPTPLPDTVASPVPIYYAGDTPSGPRLFRYFEPVRGGEPDHGTGTVIGLLMATPSDPDYRTLWPGDSLEELVADGDVITVGLRDDAVRDRPADMTAEEAALAIQQVIFTAQAAVQRRLPVQFVLEGNPIDQVFGVPTSEPVANAPQLDVLALVSISNPSEARLVGDSFTADGVASAYEGNVPWELRDADGTVVRQGFAHAGNGTHLTPWRTEPIDVSDLEPGTYTFAAATEHPSASERTGPFTDTRTVVVQ